MLKKKIHGTSLAVQWLRLCASDTGGVGLIPGWGTKIPHATWSSQIKKNSQIISKLPNCIGRRQKVVRGGLKMSGNWDGILK